MTGASGELRERLRARGYRSTPQRKLVLDAVWRLEHATPEEVLAAVRRRDSAVNVSTVYRALELLESLGLVTHTHLGHGPRTYHTTSAPQHLHLVCRACSSVTEVEPSVAAGLVEALRRDEGFATDLRHLTIFGLCAGCSR